MHQISFRFFQRGISPEREIIRTRKTTRVKYFSMRNPYMKFQNPSMHGSWTDGRTHAHMDGRTHNPKPICPINFSEVGGINPTWFDSELASLPNHLTQRYLWQQNRETNISPDILIYHLTQAWHWKGIMTFLERSLSISFNYPGHDISTKISECFIQ